MALRWHTYGHNNDQQHSTCPQPCEPLLARWIVGAQSLWEARANRTQTMGRNNNNGPATSMGWGMMARQTTQGGPRSVSLFFSFYFPINETTRWWLQWTTRREGWCGERDNRRWGGREGEWPSNHQHPTDEQQPSTCPQPCEPLLMGWVVGASSWQWGDNK